MPAGGRSADTLRVSVVARAGRYVINGEERGFTVGDGWGLLANPHGLPFKAAFRAAWIGALFLPAGFWCRNRTDGAVVALGVLSGLLVVPALTLLVHTPLAQWAATGVGVGGGVQLRRWWRRHAAG